MVIQITDNQCQSRPSNHHEALTTTLQCPSERCSGSLIDQLSGSTQRYPPMPFKRAGTLVGALIMGVLRNGLNLLGVSSFLQQIVIGAVIVVAVLIDTWLKRRNRT